MSFSRVLFCIAATTTFALSSDLLAQSGSKSKELSLGASTVTYPSEDGITITAEQLIKHSDPKSPFVILFHQARSSRGEYKSTSKKFANLGANTLAVDARSGDRSNGIANKTAKAAAAAGKPTQYGDAYPDLVASVGYAKSHFPDAPIVVVGSSYSASLVFKLAAQFPDDIKAALAFSPAVGRWNQSWLIPSARKVTAPVFITSAQTEVDRWKPISAVLSSPKDLFFEPDFPGRHGASALWPQSAGSEKYWQQVKTFLARVTKAQAGSGNKKPTR